MEKTDNSKFTERLKSDVSRSPQQEEFDRKISEHIKNHGSVKLHESIFCDDYNCGGFEEYVIKPESGGTFTKFYGCSILWKGEIKNDVIDSLAPVKRALMSTIALMAKPPFVFVVPILFLFKKQVIKQSIRWIVRIYRADAIKKQIPYNEFNRVEKEIVDVFTKYAKDNIKDGYFMQEVIDFGYFIAMVFQFDCAYRFPFQDAFSKNPITFINTLIKREHWIGEKWRWIRVLLFILLLTPSGWRFSRKFLSMFDEENMALYSDELYFCLDRERYDFCGLPYADRVRLKEFIDNNKRHFIPRV